MRRYGNRPGLIFAPVLLAALGLASLMPASAFGYGLLKVLAAVLVLLMVWHWRQYRDELRAVRARRRARSLARLG